MRDILLMPERIVPLNEQVSKDEYYVYKYPPLPGSD